VLLIHSRVMSLMSFEVFIRHGHVNRGHRFDIEIRIRHSKPLASDAVLKVNVLQFVHAAKRICDYCSALILLHLFLSLSCFCLVRL